MEKDLYPTNKSVFTSIALLLQGLLFLLISACCMLLGGCSDHSKKVSNDISNSLNKVVSLNMIDSVMHLQNYLTMKDMQMRYKYISLVHLKFGCGPCYNRFVEWHYKIDSIGRPPNHAVLFVINGDNYEEFLSKVPKNSNNVFDQYIVMDPDDNFRRFNNEIPLMLLESSVLIDSEKKIRMIGSPFATSKMTELFHKICSQ